jgi:hypothetical protein
MQDDLHTKDYYHKNWLLVPEEKVEAIQKIRYRYIFSRLLRGVEGGLLSGDGFALRAENTGLVPSVTRRRPSTDPPRECVGRLFYQQIEDVRAAERPSRSGRTN